MDDLCTTSFQTRDIAKATSQGTTKGNTVNEQTNPETSGTETPAEAEVIPPTEAPAPLDGWVLEDGTFILYSTGNRVGDMALENVAAHMTHQRRTINEQHETITKSRYEQIDGSDPRLADFWAKAQELADNANHCEIFDNIAEALGGPRREREFEVVVNFQVTVPVSYTVTVMARDEDEARDQAEEAIGYMSTSDFEDYASWYDADVDGYSFSSEVC